MIVLEIVLSLERSPPAPSHSAAAATAGLSSARICKDKLAIGGGQRDDRQSLCQAFSLALPLSLSFSMPGCLLFYSIYFFNKQSF